MRSLFILFICFFSFSNIYTQENLESHDYSLVFGISNNFKIKKFNLTVAGKILIDESRQLRLLFSPKLVTNSKEITGVVTNEITQIINTNDYTLRFAIDHLWTLSTNGNFELFSGLGAEFIIQNNETEGIWEPDGSNSIDKSQRFYLIGGIRGTIGAEWHLNSNIGIHGEYILSGLSQKGEAEYKFIRDGAVEPAGSSVSNRFYLRSEVLFGISIYL